MTDPDPSPTPEPVVDQSNLVAHARLELEKLGEDDETITGILNVIQAFADMGHSGGSAAIVIPMINDLLLWKNLTPLTNDPAEWVNMKDYNGGVDIWQNTRNPEAFSEDGGKTYKLLSEGTQHRSENPIPTP